MTNRLSEVSRLTAALANEILSAQATDQAIPRDQIQALVGGAHLLRERGVDWPPMLTQALHGLAEGIQEEPTLDSSQQATAAGAVIEGLTRFMGAFRKEKGPA